MSPKPRASQPAAARLSLPRAAVWLVLAAWSALAGRVALTKPIGDYFTETDFYGGYGIGAQALLEGAFDAARYGIVGPLYEVCVALVGLTGIDLYRAALIVSWLAGLAALWLLARATRRTLGEWAALAAVLAAASNATWFRFATSATTDALFLACVAGALQAALSGVALRAGLLAAAAALTRYPGVLLLGALALASFLPAGLRPWPSRPLRAGGIAVGVGLAVVAGWIALSALTGTVPKPAFYHNVAYEVFGRPAGVTWDEYGETMAAEFPTPATLLERDPGRLATHTLQNIGTHAVDDARETYGWVFTAAAVLGLLLSPPARRLGVVWVFAALYFLAHAPVFYAARYSLPLVWCAAVAAGGIAAPGDAWRKRWRQRRRWAAAAAAGAVLAVAVVGVVRTVREQGQLARQWPVQVLEVTRDLRPAPAAAPRVVLARKPHAPWLAGGRWASLGPAEGLPSLGQRAREMGATHLFVSWPEAQTRPAIAFLLLPDQAPPGLRPLRVSRDGLAVLYEVGDSLGVVLPPWQPADYRWRNAEGAWMADHENLDALRLAASGRHANGDLARAEELYRELVVRDPENLVGYVDLGKVLILEGKPEAALRLFDALRARGAEHPDIWRGIAEAAVRVGQRERAIAALERYLASREDPGAAAVLEQLRAGGAP